MKDKKRFIFFLFFSLSVLSISAKIKYDIADDNGRYYKILNGTTNVEFISFGASGPSATIKRVVIPQTVNDAYSSATNRMTLDTSGNLTASSFNTTNFTIVQSGTKLLFKYGATTIASMDSTGIITSATNIVANGTP